MASLKQYVTRVIDALDQPFNKMLYERVKDILISERSLAYRRSIAKNGIDDEFKQRYLITVERVDKSDFYQVQTDLQVFRSENKIAKLIRFRGDSPFTYVGSVTHDIPFIYTQPYAVPNLDALRYMKYITKFTYNNGYIYIFSHINTLTNVAVESIFVDPREIDNSDNSNAATPFTDDMEFLLSEDLFSDIMMRILSGELKVTLPDDRETEIVNDEVAEQ